MGMVASATAFLDSLNKISNSSSSTGGATFLEADYEEANAEKDLLSFGAYLTDFGV